uniref:Uncharacterized protein n=1 Tax=Compsopogon caeruleus TaxID=31354 RepID=A0A7S1TE11_9RHOD|mmetsp:Transcript_274/g.474  ORF Transcript_274/g.474 Transcript_274/m.474 type:complete len:102 (+) Transcript_274:38-343(+)
MNGTGDVLPLRIPGTGSSRGLLGRVGSDKAFNRADRMLRAAAMMLAAAMLIMMGLWVWVEVRLLDQQRRQVMIDVVDDIFRNAEAVAARSTGRTLGGGGRT